MLEYGFIKIDRKITSWRWYQDGNTFRVFFHLILTANYEDKDFEKITVKRGERVISYPKLANELQMSIQSVRTAINHLKSTGEVTVKSYPKYSVISIINYNQYQQSNTIANSQLTGYQQGANSQLTGNQQQCKKDKEVKKDKEYSTLRFGEYKHVKLTQEQYDKLISEYSKTTIDDYIAKMDEWIQLKGKKYKDFNLALRNWLNRDNVQKGNENGETTEFRGIVV